MVIISLLKLMVYCLLRNCCVRCSARFCVGSTTFYYVNYSFQLNSNSFWSEASPLYADDTEIYTSFVTEDIIQSLIVVQSSMLVIQVWMNQNMLKLNPSKTEFMTIGNSTQRKKIAHIFPVELLIQNFDEIDYIRNLGVAFDPACFIHKKMYRIFVDQLSPYLLSQTHSIHLDKATANSLANAPVCSRLDYCNSLLFGCSEKYKTSLQRVQNCLARVVTRSSRLSESSPLLKSLHYLLNKSRIKFKLNLSDI